MAGDRDIQEAVKYLAGTHQTDRVTMIDATVNSVDQQNRICDCTAITGPVGSDLPNVRLMSSVDDGLLILPTVGSTVTVLLSIFCDPVIISYSEIDQVIFRGGDLGGLPVTPQVVDRLNNVEKLLNDLIAKYNTHTHFVASTGAPSASTTTIESDTLELTVRSDIENTAITQG